MKIDCFVLFTVEFINQQLVKNEISDVVFENLKKSWIAHGLKKRQDEFTNKFSVLYVISFVYFSNQ
jgi:hypothetical protein